MSKAKFFNLILAASALCAPFGFASSDQPGSGPIPRRELPFDDLRGSSLNFETAPVAPLCFSPDGAQLFVLNTQGSRVAVFDTASWQRVNEFAVGLGAAALAWRPGTRELWVVDRMQSCISVIDVDLGAIVRSIRVGGEPYGLVFTPSADRAYVTSAGLNRVDVVRTSDYANVGSIAVPARSPRGIAMQAGAAWIAPFLSGNDTAPRGLPGAVDDVRSVVPASGAGLQPLPDRDLFAIRPQALPQQDALDASATRSALGTILFNVHARPGTNELWIPNTDALNGVLTGERAFVGGQVVRNRITIVDALGAQAPRVIDLDALAPPGAGCSQPTGVAFDPVRPRAYVCAYGSDRVVALDLGGPNPTWAGSLRIPGRLTYPRGSGPRACIVDATGHWLYVHLMMDKSVLRVDLTALPASGFDLQMPPGTSLGFELVAGGERFGRHLFHNAELSKSKTSSCGSCHVDGHTDGLAWDLSHFLDPESTPSAGLTFGTEVKGPMVTQSTRRLKEVGPFHWRGERRKVSDFNAAFPNLLEHEVNGVPADIGGDIAYISMYTENLALPPNPRENLDRSLTPLQRTGAQIFQERLLANGLTCAACHALPLGSSGEIVTEVLPGIPRAIDVPSLRGIGDRAGPAWTIGGDFGTRAELGAGFGHTGAKSTLADSYAARSAGAVGAHQFALAPNETAALEAFLMAFDTGVAPAAGFQVTAHAGNAAAVENGELAFLIQQARAGNCDLVALRTPMNDNGVFVMRSALFDAQSGLFQPSTSVVAPFAPHSLILEAQAGHPVTFLGLPLSMGYPFALDRDMDGLYNLDERRLGLNAEFGNMDLDSYPDGYELAWGLDPRAVDAPGSSPDTQPPQLAGPTRLVYATTNTIKFDFETTEPSQVFVAYNGNYWVQRLPIAAHKDKRFSIVLDDLQPDTDYHILLQFKDPAGNLGQDNSTHFRTKARATPIPVHVEAIGLQLLNPGPAASLIVDVSLAMAAQPAGAGYAVFGSLYYQRADGTLQLIEQDTEHVTDSIGRASFRRSLASLTGIGGGTLLYVVHDIVAPPGASGYARAHDVITVGSAAY